ncbi:Muscle-specific protein 20 [Boothiomyces sp. JEL0838]|nr:Muscle-specific protein 20 [Boothiomyces sp. JEL0838]
MLAANNNPQPVKGLDSDLKLKRQSKYSPEREQEAREWIEQVAFVQLEGEFADALKDGVALCKLINNLMPDRKPIKPSTSKLAFKQMENIHAFLQGVTDLGVPSFESFQTIDLYEKKNMNQVVDCIFAISRVAEKNGFDGPRLGPKLAQKVERNFTEEQLKEAKFAVPKLTGFTGGASQSGMNIGQKRQIGGVYLDTKTGSSEVDTAPLNGVSDLQNQVNAMDLLDDYYSEK